eukprot:TRINITY_DN21222_c0_g1_i1.p2 TRINITY_DN21222_c0_g1~~TRINITY_DN21222_c0_g1_i1.p2  ORF type:complete len:284 (+),score=30.69 TRINITY_DN21222_c0_g1_i1:86-937(+)
MVPCWEQSPLWTGWETHDAVQQRTTHAFFLALNVVTIEKMNTGVWEALQTCVLSKTSEKFHYGAAEYSLSGCVGDLLDEVDLVQAANHTCPGCGADGLSVGDGQASHLFPAEGFENMFRRLGLHQDTIDAIKHNIAQHEPLRSFFEKQQKISQEHNSLGNIIWLCSRCNKRVNLCATPHVTTNTWQVFNPICSKPRHDSQLPAWVVAQFPVLNASGLLAAHNQLMQILGPFVGKLLTARDYNLPQDERDMFDFAVDSALDEAKYGNTQQAAEEHTKNWLATHC